MKKIIENWGEDVRHKNNQKITMTRKIKIRKIGYCTFLSIQPIADLSYKFEKLKKTKKKFI